MRQGIDRRGRHLYPAFPYDYFAGVADDDMKAIYAYLMSRPAVSARPVANELRFPYSVRPLLAGWKLLYHRPAPFKPNPDFTDEENRGFYLATTLGHCSACHSPRNALGAVKTGAGLAGGMAEGWMAPPLGQASVAPVGWDVKSYADDLFDGWSKDHGLAGGPMAQVIDNMYDVNEDDIFAVAAWLARISPKPDKAANEAARKKIAALDLSQDFDPSFAGQNPPAEALAGAKVFKTNCVKCHKTRIADTQPVSLGLTYAVNAPEPTNVFNTVLHGLEPTNGASARRMQAVSLSADDLAAVAAFLRWHFTDKPAWNDLPAKAARAVEAARAH